MVALTSEPFQMKAILFLFLSVVLVQAELKVASLNPIVTELLEKVGGEDVTIVEITKPGMDPHRFQPAAKDLQSIAACRLIFVMGKGLEPFLEGLEDSLGRDQALVEVGKDVPSLTVGADAIYRCCPDHAHGAEDPHWWQDIANLEIAAKTVGQALGKVDPENRIRYLRRALKAGSGYRAMDRWARQELAKVKEEHRVLITSHAAFGYFCKAYNFEAGFVQGLSKEAEISASDLAQLLRDLKDTGVPAVFPEEGANLKALEQVARETGSSMAEPLHTDLFPSGYEKGMRENVERVVKALAGR